MKKAQLFALFVISLYTVYATSAEWFNPIHQPKTNFSATGFFSPFSKTSADSASSGGVGATAWGGQIVSEIPLYWPVNVGFMIEFLKWSARTPQYLALSLSDGLKPEDVPPFSMSLDVWTKFQWPFVISGMALAPYVSVPFGITLLVAPQGPLMAAGATQSYMMAAMKNDGAGQRAISMLGYGPNVKFLGGVEFFPIEEIGVYAEAGLGLEAMYHYSIQCQGKTIFCNTFWQDNNTKSLGYMSYLLYGLRASFGVKINY